MKKEHSSESDQVSEALIFSQGYEDRWKYRNPKSTDPIYLRGWNNADKDAEDLNPRNYPDDKYEA